MKYEAIRTIWTPGFKRIYKIGFWMWDIRGRWNVGRIEFSDVRHRGGNGGGEGFRMRAIRVEWRRRKILGVRHPDGNGGGERFRVWDTWMEMAAQKDFGCETPEWKWRCRRIPGVGHLDGNDGAEGFRVWDTRMEMLLWVARMIGMGCLDMEAWVSGFNGYVKEWRMACTRETPCKWGGE